MRKYFSKKTLIWLVVALTIIGTFTLAATTYASVGDTVAQIIGWIVIALVNFIGTLLMLVMWILIKIAQYNSFGTASPVVYGWTIVRDISNMFFIVILLFIAFATILQVPNYTLKNLLPKLIIMAVLINFSRLICNVITDFVQVIMLTFVNGFKEAGAGNLTEMLGITDLLEVKADPKNDINVWTILGSYLLALLYSIVALVTIFTMVSVLAMRMIMCWVYIVMSPLAYVANAFPQTQSYFNDWWSKFMKNLIVGPILAFFIWLSFASLGGTSTIPSEYTGTDPVKDISSPSISDQDKAAGQARLGTMASSSGPSAAVTAAGSPDHMIKFIIGIAMLIGGLQMAQELGGEAGKAAGKGMARLQKMQAWGSKQAKGAGVAVARKTGQVAGSGALAAVGGLTKLGTGRQINAETGRKEFRGNSLTRFTEGWNQDLKGSRKKVRQDKRQEFLEKTMGIGEAGAEAGVAMTGAIKNKLNFTDKIKKREQATLSSEAYLKANKEREEGVDKQKAGNEFLNLDKREKKLDERKKAAHEAKDFDKEKKIDAELKTISDKKMSLANSHSIYGEGSAKDLIDDGQKQESTNWEEMQKLRPKTNGFWAKMVTRNLNLGNTIAEPTHGAFKKMNEENKNAKVMVEGIEENGLQDMSPSEVAGSHSLNVSQKKFWKKFSGSQKAVQNAIADFNEMLKDAEDETDVKAKKAKFSKAHSLMRSFGRGMKAHKDGGGSMSNLRGMESFLNSRAAVTNDPKALKSVDQYKMTNTDRGWVREGDKMGATSVKRFNDNQAGDKSEDRNEISIDFAKLANAGFSGGNVNPDAGASNLNKNQIGELANYLEKNGSAEGIAPADLEATLKGLRGGDLDNLTLVNSGVKASDSEEGFESRGEVRKRYHENMHKGGLDDENLTHQLDKAMVELRVTGGPKGEEHNSIKIGRMAAEKKASGMSNDQIMKEMRQAMVKDFGGKATLPKVFKENAPTASVINNITNNNVSNLRQGDVITNEGDTHNTTNVSGTSASDIKKTIDNSLKNNNPKLVRNIGGKVAGAVRPIAAGIKKQTLMQRKQGSKLSGLKDEIEDIDGGSDES